MDIIVPTNGTILKTSGLDCNISSRMFEFCLYNVRSRQWTPSSPWLMSVTVLGLSVGETSSVECDHSGLQMMNHPIHTQDGSVMGYPQFFAPVSLCYKLPNSTDSPKSAALPISEYTSRTRNLLVALYSYSMTNKPISMRLHLLPVKRQGLDVLCNKVSFGQHKIIDMLPFHRGKFYISYSPQHCKKVLN